MRAQALETPEQARLQRGAIQHLPGGHTMEDVRKPDPEVRFFQNISQTRHRPTPHEFGVYPQSVGWLLLGIQRGQFQLVWPLRAERHLRIPREASGAVCQRGLHPVLHASDAILRALWLWECRRVR